MANLGSEIQNKSNGMATGLRSKAQNVEEQLEKFSHTAGERVGEMASNFSEQAQDYIKTGREYVKTNPAKGVAIAAAIGIVAGGLLTLVFGKRSK